MNFRQVICISAFSPFVKYRNTRKLDQNSFLTAVPWDSEIAQECNEVLTSTPKVKNFRDYDVHTTPGIWPCGKHLEPFWYFHAITSSQPEASAYWPEQSLVWAALGRGTATRVIFHIFKCGFWTSETGPGLGLYKLLPTPSQRFLELGCSGAPGPSLSPLARSLRVHAPPPPYPIPFR